MIPDLGPDDVLIVHQTNPAYSLPHLRESIGQAGHRPVPRRHDERDGPDGATGSCPCIQPLEAWGDYEPWTGIHCLMQPTMGALHDSRHSGDIFLSLAADVRPAAPETGSSQPTSFDDWLRLDWRQLHERVAPDTEFEAFWQQSLQRGGCLREAPGSRTGAARKTRKPDRAPARPPIADSNPDAVPTESASSERGAVQLWLWPSIKLFDGRLANRGWMQEVPERMSTIAWGSWIDISPAKAGSCRWPTATCWRLPTRPAG